MRLLPNPKSKIANPKSFDHSIGSRQHSLRNRQPNLLCGLQIDHQLELSRLFHREISGLGAF